MSGTQTHTQPLSIGDVDVARAHAGQLVRALSATADALAWKLGGRHVEPKELRQLTAGVALLGFLYLLALGELGSLKGEDDRGDLAPNQIEYGGSAAR